MTNKGTCQRGRNLYHTKPWRCNLDIDSHRSTMTPAWHHGVRRGCSGTTRTSWQCSRKHEGAIARCTTKIGCPPFAPRTLPRMHLTTVAVTVALACMDSALVTLIAAIAGNTVAVQL